jgi:hypothetical protein
VTRGVKISMCLLKNLIKPISLFSQTRIHLFFFLFSPSRSSLSLHLHHRELTIFITMSSSSSSSHHRLHQGNIIIFEFAYTHTHKRSCTYSHISPSILNRIQRISSADSSTRRDGSFDSSLDPYSPRFVELWPNEQIRKF